ncbi:MAG: hypothetical protein ABWJ42_00230 [Sulfolobales archaeon]
MRNRVNALFFVLVAFSIVSIISLVSSNEYVFFEPQTPTNTTTTVVENITTTNASITSYVTTTQTLTLIVYPVTTQIPTTIVSVTNNTPVTVVENMTTLVFTLAPTATYTEYKVISVTTTRPPEVTERGAWISAGLFVGILTGLTIGYAYYARGVSIRRRKR